MDTLSEEQAQARREADAQELAKLTSGERAPYRTRRIDYDGAHFTAAVRFGDGARRRVRRVGVQRARALTVPGAKAPALGVAVRARGAAARTPRAAHPTMPLANPGRVNPGL